MDAHLQVLDAIMAEVELFQHRAVLQARHAGQPVALQRQLPQRAQAAEAKYLVISISLCRSQTGPNFCRPCT